MENILLLPWVIIETSHFNSVDILSRPLSRLCEIMLKFPPKILFLYSWVLYLLFFYSVPIILKKMLIIVHTEH